MNKPTHEECYKGYTISIHLDECPGNPREWDNLGVIAAFHNRYTLGDKTEIRHQDYSGWDDMERHIREDLKAVVVLPLYMYDHSGITIRTYPFSCPWDSGQIGFIYVTEEKFRKEFGEICDESLDKATRILEDEVKLFDHYLVGNVYGYTLLDPEGVDLDEGCWGFYGGYEVALAEARAVIDRQEAEDFKYRMVAGLALTGMEE